MSKLIRNLSFEYNHQFPPQWIEMLDWSNDDESVKSFKEASIKIDALEKECFVCFAKSLIMGEYITDYSLSEDLDGFKGFLIEDDHPYDNQYKSALSSRLAELSGSISYMIDSYKHFIVNLVNKYRLENHHYLVSAFSTRGRHSKLPRLFLFFCGNALFVYNLEHNLKKTDETISGLILRKRELEEYVKDADEEVGKVIRILVSKCHFLLIKLLYKENNTPEYLLDFEKYTLKETVDIRVVDEILSDFKFLSRDYYSQQEERIKPIQDKVLGDEQLSFLEYIILVKYYKDSTYGTERQLSNLISSFEHRYDQVYPTFRSQNYDIFALKTIKNYIYNCRLSFLSKKGTSDYGHYMKEIETIVGVQNETGIFNFYPYKKASIFVLDNLKAYLHSASFKDEVFDARMKDLESFAERFKSSLKWCEESCFTPVLSLYNDCCPTDDETGIAIFSPSSIGGFIDYEDQWRDLANLEQEIRLIKTERALKQESRSVEDLHKEIQQTRRTYLEIFGVFTTVVTFIYGSINIFSKGGADVNSGESNNPIVQSNLGSEIMMFGTVLLVFISLIYFITLPQEDKAKAYFKHPKTWVFLVLLLVMLFLLVFRFR